MIVLYVKTRYWVLLGRIRGLVSKERSSEAPYAEWFGLLPITYDLRETEEFMEKRSKQRKAW